MSITSVTRFHSISGQEGALLALQSEGRRRMIGADGCEAFDILQDQPDPQTFVFVQTWASREAHDTAFGELIIASGHLEKVLAVLDEEVTQTILRKECPEQYVCPSGAVTEMPASRLCSRRNRSDRVLGLVGRGELVEGLVAVAPERRTVHEAQGHRSEIPKCPHDVSGVR